LQESEISCHSASEWKERKSKRIFSFVFLSVLRG
jgi:hypothetical protein